MIQTDPSQDALEETIRSMGDEIDALQQKHAELSEAAGLTDASPLLEIAPEVTRLTIFHQYIWVLIVAFGVTLFATPVMRRIAISLGVIDHPADGRKVHRLPIAYMGGVAVYLGILAGIVFSMVALNRTGLIEFHTISDENLNEIRQPFGVPPSILIGLTIIMVIGLWDDISGIPPMTKVGGQLMAAALLAYQDVGTKVAAGLIVPLASALGFDVSAESTLVYWAGAAVIAIFVLGACNASNLIDGLDGLLTGVTAIASFGLLLVALSLALEDDGPRDAQRIILCMALLGACLGFLPHNFNPATIFLGDCGSLLLGYTTIVIILTLGDTGKTHLVFAGLFIYAIPIIDTVLAIIRRKMSGKGISDPDDQHLHHMLKRGLGVKGAVLMLYAIGCGFAVLGVAMSLGRARVAYAVALLFAAYIGVTAIKIARLRHIEEAAGAAAGKRNGGAGNS